MAQRQRAQYSRIAQDEDCDGLDYVHADHYCAKVTNLSWPHLINCFLVLVVICLGASLFIQLQPATTSCTDKLPSDHLLQQQYGLSARIPTTYDYFQKGFDDNDFEKGDPYWAGLFPKGNGLVFLSDEMVELYKLPPSARQPQRGNLSFYESAGYHSLHCLSSIRGTLARFITGQRTSQPYMMDDNEWIHVRHCIADARQALLCQYDETLLVGHDNRHPGGGQTKLCKDLDPINKWLEDHYISLE